MMKWIVTECGISRTKRHKSVAIWVEQEWGGVGMQKKMLLKDFSARLGKQAEPRVNSGLCWLA